MLDDTYVCNSRKFIMIKLPLILQIISKELQTKNARAIVVGGSVYDHFLKLPSKRL